MNRYIFLALLLLLALSGSTRAQDKFQPDVKVLTEAEYDSVMTELFLPPASFDSQSLVAKYAQIYAMAPSCSRIGQFYYDSVLTTLRQCTAIGSPGTWVSLATGTPATIPSTTNLIKGDGAGNGADSGIVPANVATLSGTTAFSAIQTISKNAATIPAGETGTLLNLGNVDGTASRVQATGFAAQGFFSARRANGTAASPTNLVLDNQIGALNFGGYMATGYSGVQASMGGFASGTWTDSSNPTYLLLRTTPSGSTTLTTALTLASDQSATFANTVNATTFVGAVTGHSSLDLALTGGTLSGGLTMNGAAITLSGNISASGIFGTGGIRIKGVAATFNDTTSSGTVAAAYTDTLGGNTLTATGATTITDYNTVNIQPATASTNVTITRKHSLGILDSTNATSSITGAFVVAAAYGTTATSVGIGGGNINAGGLITGGTVTSAGAFTAGSTITQTSNSATAFESGPNGATNPVFRLVNSIGSQADGVSVQGNAAGAGTTFTALSSGSNSGFIFTPKGTGSTAGSPAGFVVNQPSGGNNALTLTDGTRKLSFATSSTEGQIGMEGAHNLSFYTSNSIRFSIINSNGFLQSASGFGYGWTAANATSTLDTNISRAAAKVIQFGDTAANTNGWFNYAGQTRVSTQFDKTTDTALANVPGLSVTVAAGRTYTFRAVLHLTPSAVGGQQIAVAGTATATAVTYQVNSINNTTNANILNSRVAALGGAGVGVAGGTADFTTVEGTITVNAGGTLTVQFAQNVSNGTSSVLVGSTFLVMDVP